MFDRKGKKIDELHSESESSLQLNPLPNEMWRHVFSFFNKYELAQAGEVCRTFHDISCDEKLQKNAPWPMLDYTKPLPGKKIMKFPGKLFEFDRITCFAELPGYKIVSGSPDGKLRIWDIMTGSCIKEFIGHQYSINSVACMWPDSKIVSASDDYWLRIWDPETGDRLQTLTGHAGPVTCVACVGRDGKIVSGSHDGTLRIWDSKTGDCLKILGGHWGPVTCVAAWQDGKFVSGSYDQSLCIWDLETEEPLKTLIMGSPVTCLDVWPDGKIASGSFEGDSLCVWDRETGECLKIFDEPKHLSFHADSYYFYHIKTIPDNKIVSVSGPSSDDRMLSILDFRTGKRIHVVSGHECPINCVGIRQDGRIMSASLDRTLRVWSFACLKPQLQADNSVKIYSPRIHSAWMK